MGCHFGTALNNSIKFQHQFFYLVAAVKKLAYIWQENDCQSNETCSYGMCADIAEFEVEDTEVEAERAVARRENETVSILVPLCLLAILVASVFVVFKRHQKGIFIHVD